MNARIICPLAVILAAIIGITFQDDPYRLKGIGMPADQLALDHRDSPYAHITWVVSDANNYAELRFFDKVEGGVCLYPTWEELGQYGDGSLSHIAMPADADLAGGKPGKTWPKDLAKPNPGTVAKSPYVNMFPTGILLNERLMKQAGGDLRKAKPNIMVIGLGSGVGISVLAHHFPEASIAVVDIDQAVIRMVKDHYPFINWLSQQQTSDGRPRLKLSLDEVADARQYVRYPSVRNDDNRQYDLVIVDAYTDGSTIPPHLMTKEFYQDIMQAMPEDGIIMSNIIGSYTGVKSRVVGGAIRSMRAAGLLEVMSLPIVIPVYDRDGFKDNIPRNNIVLASKAQLDPQNNRAGWNRLAEFKPYPELPLRRWTSRMVALGNQRGGAVSAFVGLSDKADKLVSSIKRRATVKPRSEDPKYYTSVADSALVQEAKQYVSGKKGAVLGWDVAAQTVLYMETDWIHHARAQWRNSVQEGRKAVAGGFRHQGSVLVGPMEGSRDNGSWTIMNAPLFTDAMPNADIFNR